MANSKIPSTKPLHTQNPATLDSWRDLSVLLKEVRIKTGLTQNHFASRANMETWRLQFIELGYVRPTSKDLSAYFGIVLSVGICPIDIFETYCRAKNMEIGSTANLSANQKAYAAPICSQAAITSNEYDIVKCATTDPKGLLLSARWLPARAGDRMERITFFSDYIDKVDGIKEYCKTLALEAQQMLATYKEICDLFDTYAADLPGYTLVKNQFYYGQTLNTVLENINYTRRWAQTLQKRTLATFQQRVKEQYDK